MNRIGWIHRAGGSGLWGDPANLDLPSDGRGLLLAEGVFETVLVLAGRPQWLAAHLQRWHHGAELLGLAPPPGLKPVQELLHEAIARSGISTGALRLNWCRGSAARGLQPPTPGSDDAERHLWWLQLSATTPCFAPVRVIISPSELRVAGSVLSRCKSFGYGSALIARRQAVAAGADDALLPSSAGGLCCGTSANLLLHRDGCWQTPHHSSGCLGGIMRAQALERGLAIEAPVETPIDAAALHQADAALLLNSLGCRPIVELEQRHRHGPSAHEAVAMARHLWDQLLEDGPSS